MRITSLTCLLAAFACMLTVPPSRCGAQELGVQLTVEEGAWIAEHPVLKVANELDWPPFDFAENGKPLGYSIDLVRLVAEKTGLQVEFVNGLTWAELMDRFKQGDIDVLPAVYESEERKVFALFTPSYFSQPSVMVVRSDDDSIESLDDLNTRKVAAIRGFMISDTLRDKFPAVVRVPVDNVTEGMNAVSTGDATVLPVTPPARSPPRLPKRYAPLTTPPTIPTPWLKTTFESVTVKGVSL